MKYTEPGIYELTYSAKDECGNEKESIRTVKVYNLNTTMFSDGTLIINEKSTDREENIRLHGAVLAEYAPAPYSFNTQTDIPWLSAYQRTITKVEFGSPVKQTSCKRLFNALYAVTEIDLTGLDTSECTDMSIMFSGCTRLNSVNTELLDTSNVTDMMMMFYENQSIQTLDLSSFDTAKVTNMGQMFRRNGQLHTIYASANFVTGSVTSSNNMFEGCTNLAGAISYDSTKVDKTYANFNGYLTAKG